MGIFGSWKKQKQFQQLYQDYEGFIRASLYWVGPPNEVDDLVQETFIKAWRGWEKFEGRSQAKTWLYRIAMNVAKDSLRKKDFERDDTKEEELPAQETPDFMDIRAALEKLNFEQRESVSLFYYWGYTMKEISSLTGRPEGTIKSQIHHAKLKLEEVLEERDKV